MNSSPASRWKRECGVITALKNLQSQLNSRQTRRTRIPLLSGGVEHPAPIINNVVLIAAGQEVQESAPVLPLLPSVSITPLLRPERDLLCRKTLPVPVKKSTLQSTRGVWCCSTLGCGSSGRKSGMCSLALCPQDVTDQGQATQT